MILPMEHLSIKLKKLLKNKRDKIIILKEEDTIQEEKWT